jgi:hypothetical protein
VHDYSSREDNILLLYIIASAQYSKDGRLLQDSTKIYYFVTSGSITRYQEMLGAGNQKIIAISVLKS